MQKRFISTILAVVMMLSAVVFASAEPVGDAESSVETVYQQNFDSVNIADTGLVNLSTNNPSTAINEGRLEITADNSDTWIGLPTTVPTDMKEFVLTFDMCNLSLPASGYHNGMAYRFSDASNYARATMRANGTALINTVVGGGFKGCSDALSVVEKDMTQAGVSVGTDTIPLGITYTFRVVVSADDVSVYINDVPATRRHGSDNYFDAGKIAFFVSKNCKVAFDNIKIENTTVVYDYEDGDVVFAEDFSSATVDSLNFGSTGTVSLASIVDGRYLISAGSSDVWITFPDTFDTAMKSFTYEVEMTNVSLPTAAYHNGIVYRFGSTASFERATLRANGEALMNSQYNGAWVSASKDGGSVIAKPLTDSGLDVGSDEIPLGITYRLRVEVTPEETRFYVNGINAGVRRAIDSKMSSGKLGLYISKNCTVAFDNIKVTYGVDPLESYDYEKGDVVFADDFSEATAADLKYKVVGTNATLSVTDERLVVVAGSTDAWVTLPDVYDKSMDAFVFEAEMTNLSLPTATYHNGIVYRYVSTGNFERATLRANGEALLHSQMNGAWVGASKNGGSSIVKSLAAALELDTLGEGEIPLNISYHLRVEVNENETRYYVNGIYAGVRTVADSQIDSGSLGFYVSKNCSVAFDNIKVTYGSVEFEPGIQDITGNSSPEGETADRIVEEEMQFTQTKPVATEPTATEEETKGCKSSIDHSVMYVVSMMALISVILMRKKEREYD